MKIVRKIVSGIWLALAVLAIAYALAFFTVIFWPESPVGSWLARNDPLFRLLQSSDLRPASGETQPGFQQKERRQVFVQGPHMVVVGPGHMIFEQPDIDSPVIGEVQRWLRLPALEEKEGWFKLEFSLGEGWIHPIAGAKAIARNNGSAVVDFPTEDVADGGQPGEMRVEIYFEPDDGRRPDAVYFDHPRQRPRPLLFSELFSSYDSEDLASLPRGVDSARLQQAMVALGGDAEQRRVGEFILRYRDSNWADKAENVLSNLRNQYLDTFNDVLPENPVQERVFVFLLPSMEAYKSFYPRARSDGAILTAGNYEPGIIALHNELGPEGDTIRTLVHEAVHHLNHTVLQFPADATVLWLDEGLANYFSLSKINDDGIAVGEIERSHRLFSNTSSGTVSTMLHVAPPSFRIIWLKQRLSGGSQLDLTSLIDESDRDKFYSGNILYNYTVSWMLVHFFMHTQGGGYRDGFMRYIKGVSEGRSGSTSLVEELGAPIRQLEGEFKRYVQRQ